MVKKLSPAQVEMIKERLSPFLQQNLRIGSREIEKFREIGKQIASKRLKWLEESIGSLELSGTSLNQKVFDLVWLKYMKTNPRDLKVFGYFDLDHSVEWTDIQGRSFCPYLEIAKLLNLDTRVMCRYALEESVQLMIDRYLEHIQSRDKIKFGRSYERGIKPGIRPYAKTCHEYLFRQMEAEELEASNQGPIYYLFNGRSGWIESRDAIYLLR